MSERKSEPDLKLIFDSFFKLHLPEIDSGKVRNEDAAVNGEELNAAFESLHDALEMNENNELRDRLIDFSLSSVADLMLSALAGRAANGKGYAASLLHKTLRTALKDHHRLLSRKNEQLLRIVRAELEIPGWISAEKLSMDAARNFAEEIEVGLEFPHPINRNSKGKMNTAQHILAHNFYCWMSREREHYELPLFDPDRFGKFLTDIQKRLINLPGSLSMSNWEKWFSVAWDVLQEVTDGNPRRHPAFNKGGVYAGMNSERFRENFRGAFKAKARSLDELREKGISHPWL